MKEAKATVGQTLRFTAKDLEKERKVSKLHKYADLSTFSSNAIGSDNQAASATQVSNCHLVPRACILSTSTVPH